jgi:nucleotide-binding universal stress UspA family protein
MGNRIVCGVDGSGGGWRAASVTASLARNLDLAAVLVHCREGNSRSPLSGPRGLRHARRTRKRVEATAGESLFPAGIEFRVRTGDAAKELLLVAEQKDAELVVVASGRRGHGSAVLLGGVASALMRRSPCPVVIVPRDGPPPSDADLTRSVVCPIESRPVDLQVLRLAGDLASRLGSALHVVHGYQHNGAAPAGATAVPGRGIEKLHDAAERKLALALAAAEVAARPHVLALPTADALLRVAERQAGMIVVGAPAPREADALIGGHVAVPIVADARSPVVVLPPRADLAPGSGHYELPVSSPMGDQAGDTREYP